MHSSLSNYHLLFELLHDGKGNIHPELEPIDTKLIIDTLEERAGRAFKDNINDIIDWFMLTEGVASEKERVGISTVLRIKKIEVKSLSILREKESDLD